MLRGPPGLLAPVDSDVAGLSATDGVDERRAVTTTATPEMPSREAVESHQLTHIPFAPWCRSCIFGRGGEAPHFGHVGGEEPQRPRRSCRWTTSSLVCLTAQERAQLPRLFCVRATPRAGSV